jgi:hypothetical protein
MKRSALIMPLLLFFGGCYEQSYAQERAENTVQIEAIELPEDFSFRVSKEASFPTYLEAYLQGAVDAKFSHSGVVVTVRNGSVLLSNISQDENIRKDIFNYVTALVDESSKSKTPSFSRAADQASLKDAGSSGRWFPQSTILYPTQLANPLQVAFAGGFRARGSIAGSISTPVTFGDQFPLRRWSNVTIGKHTGDMQLEIEGAVFGIFNQAKYSSPLINADYYVGLPLTYAYDRWAHRLRIYHISSHLGDEYMDRKHHEKRVNKSFEAIDVFTSYYLTKQIRLYGGGGVIAHSDSEMKMKPLYAEYGLDVHAGRREWKDMYGTPYLSMHFRNCEDCHYKMDSNYVIGYEWGKINGLGQKFRISLGYHNGFCSDGQFSRRKSDYVQLKFAYGF